MSTLTPATMNRLSLAMNSADDTESYAAALSAIAAGEPSDAQRWTLCKAAHTAVSIWGKSTRVVSADILAAHDVVKSHGTIGNWDMSWKVAAVTDTAEPTTDAVKYAYRIVTNVKRATLDAVVADLGSLDMSERAARLAFLFANYKGLDEFYSETPVESEGESEGDESEPVADVESTPADVLAGFEALANGVAVRLTEDAFTPEEAARIAQLALGLIRQAEASAHRQASKVPAAA